MVFDSLKLSANIQRKCRFLSHKFHFALTGFVLRILFFGDKKWFYFLNSFYFGVGRKGKKKIEEKNKKTHFECKNFYKELMWGWVKSWEIFLWCIVGARILHHFIRFFFVGCSLLILLWTQFVNIRSMWTASRIFVYM